MSRDLRIEFVGLKDGEAERKAESLREALAKASLTIPVERIPDPHRQSAGVVLVVTLGIPTALIIAATIENFIGREDTSIRISTNSITIFEGGAERATELRSVLPQAAAE